SLARANQMLADETMPIYERRFRRKDGSVLVGEVNAALVYDLDGNPSHFQSIVRDVTDRKQIEQALRTSEARFRAIIRAIPDMILRIGSDNRVIEFISGQESDLLALPEPIPVQEMLLPEAADMLIQAVVDALRTREAQIRGYKLEEADAPILYEEARVVADSPDTVLAIIRDVTFYKKTEVALAEREQTAREFQDYLKRLNQINIELARAETEDELCYQAIVLGCSALGFDRALIALRDGDNLRVEYGMDREGQVRDKRHIRFQQQQLNEWQQVLRQPDRVVLWENVTLTDFNVVAGRGWYAMAVMQQGDLVLGALTIDNLRYQRPPRPYESELLALYGASLGNLIIRKRVEGQLRNREQAAREFQEYLKRLHGAHMKLARVENLDTLYRQVIQTGLEHLGFDRLGLMLITEDRSAVAGTYGTDPDGKVRDERDYHDLLSPDSEWAQRIFQDAGYVSITESTGLQDYDVEVGRGWSGIAAVWDGAHTVGVLFVDNLRHKHPPRPFEADLLALYGSIVGHLIVQKRAEETLRASENRFRTLLEAAPVGVLLVNNRGVVISSNKTAEQLFGYSSQEINRIQLEALMPETYHHVHESHRAGFFDKPRQRIMGMGMELYGLHKNGEQFPIEVALSFIEFEGEPVGMAFVADSTERKQLDRQRLELALERERTGILAQFMRDAAHEFRTPLSIINTELFLLEKSTDVERQRELRDRIQQQADNLAGLIDALTTMLRLDQSTFDQLHEINMKAVVQAIIVRFQPMLESKSMDLQADLPMSAPYVMGDSGDLAHALFCLLENAIRYNAEGGHIWLTCQTNAESLILSIRDDGIGMTPEVQEHIFERFYRADEAHTTRGFGLGLPIA
ncbi:MAG: PAS domain-containing sensor histidine kinase, partial [Anaerolineae bacterium]|nr:PAS domain-containing sensor histidine kinase [Anaerolineae bacterium]